ncbi:MAG TPA: alkaline phosphatase family protein, partial [Trebonia sp.]|nr:alkaline phosphatase family protein [Trebonia sp.]
AFVQDTESSSANGCGPEYCPPGISLDYFDGNTVTALWNYAQYYSMSDNDYDTVFGPSTPGALDVASGDTGNGYAVNPATGAKTTAPSSVSALGSEGTGTIYGDTDPYYDQCSDGNHTSTSAEGVQTSQNIGDLLNFKHVSWGWFQGGFAPTSTNAGGAVCGSSHELTSNGQDVSSVQDYAPHHNPFQYNASTANPAHLAPSSLSHIGYTDQANHQYDISDFGDALNGAGGARLPSVSYLKAPAYENAHPGNSDPLEEQNFVVNTVNQIEESKYWSSTAIVITYDDSDGWYDHVAPPVINGSNTSADTAVCSTVPSTVSSDADRCGYGDRLPFIVISPYAPENHVSSTQLNTASVVKFIEDNWLKGDRLPDSYDAVSGSIDGPDGLLSFNQRPHDQPVILNPATGAVVSSGRGGNTGKKNGGER